MQINHFTLQIWHIFASMNPFNEQAITRDSDQLYIPSIIESWAFKIIALWVSIIEGSIRFWRSINLLKYFHFIVNIIFFINALFIGWSLSWPAGHLMILVEIRYKTTTQTSRVDFWNLFTTKKLYSVRKWYINGRKHFWDTMPETRCNSFASQSDEEYGKWRHVTKSTARKRLMGVSHGSPQLDRVMELICGESHGVAQHWLDPGDGIDLCGRAMGARDTGWIGAMGLIRGDVPNDKVLYGCWI